MQLLLPSMNEEGAKVTPGTESRAYRVSISPHSSPEKDPSSFCNPAISAFLKIKELKLIPAQFGCSCTSGKQKVIFNEYLVHLKRPPDKVLNVKLIGIRSM